MRLMIACLVVLLAGCAPGRDLPPLPAADATYRLGPGDAVRLIVFGEDQLSGEFHVNDSGRIALPLVGAVPAAGLTPAGLQTAVVAALRNASLLREPSVAAEVTTYRPIFVLGEVNKPGQYPYQPGMTVVTAAAVAGGFTYRAIEDYAAVLRTYSGGDGGGSRVLEGKATRQTLVQPGDVITVFERRF